MHDGKLSRGQLQAWALNRYYYQSIIPIKDAIILSRATDPSFRRVWRKRSSSRAPRRADVKHDEEIMEILGSCH